jgi:hypothetical protein
LEGPRSRIGDNSGALTEMMSKCTGELELSGSYRGVRGT